MKWLHIWHIETVTEHPESSMDWNKEVIKKPFPPWAIVVCAILAGMFFCFLADQNNTYNKSQLVVAFVIGASAYLYLWILAKMAKNPTPWLRKNIRLFFCLGGLINAGLIIWVVLSSK